MTKTRKHPTEPDLARLLSGPAPGSHWFIEISAEHLRAEAAAISLNMYIPCIATGVTKTIAFMQHAEVKVGDAYYFVYFSCLVRPTS